MPAFNGLMILLLVARIFDRCRPLSSATLGGIASLDQPWSSNRPDAILNTSLFALLEKTAIRRSLSML